MSLIKIELHLIKAIYLIKKINYKLKGNHFRNNGEIKNLVKIIWIASIMVIIQLFLINSPVQNCMDHSKILN